MKVLFVECGKNPVVKNIDKSLESLQKCVGGYIEMVCPPSHEDDAIIIANEEGKILGLPYNRPVSLENGEWYDIIAGDFIICRAPYDSDGFESLTNEQIKIYTDMYRLGFREIA